MRLSSHPSHIAIPRPSLQARPRTFQGVQGAREGTARGGLCDYAHRGPSRSACARQTLGDGHYRAGRTPWVQSPLTEEHPVYRKRRWQAIGGAREARW